MKFSELIGAVGEEPVFESSLLLAGRSDPDGVRRQLSRWTASGKIIKLRRGLYALSPPWRRRHPHPFLVANRLMPGTYVSGLSALAHARAIPEYVPETTSVGPGKPHIRQLPLGRFSFRHVKPRLLFGYRPWPSTTTNRRSSQPRRRRFSTSSIFTPAATSATILPNSAWIATHSARKRWRRSPPAAHRPSSCERRNVCSH